MFSGLSGNTGCSVEDYNCSGTVFNRVKSLDETMISIYISTSDYIGGEVCSRKERNEEDKNCW